MTAAAAAAKMAALKWGDRGGIVGGANGLTIGFACMISRSFSVSRECDRMCRVCLLGLENVAGQYMQAYFMWFSLLLGVIDPLRSMPSMPPVPVPPPPPPSLPGLRAGDKELAGDNGVAVVAFGSAVRSEPRAAALPATNPPPLDPVPPTTDDDVASAAATVASCNQTRTETVNFLYIQYFDVVVVDFTFERFFFFYRNVVGMVFVSDYEN